MHPSIPLTVFGVLLAASASLLAQTPVNPVPGSTPRTIPSRPIVGRPIPAQPIGAQPIAAPRAIPQPNAGATMQPAATEGQAAGDVAGGLPIDENGMVGGVEYPRADILKVIGFYEQLTGKKALYDNTVQGQVSVIFKGPVTKEEAIHILETVFVLNGFTIVPGIDNIIKVIGPGKNPRNYAPPLYTDLSQIPEGDQIISFLFKLQYADPVEVQNVINQTIPPAAAAPVVLPNSQAILVTEATSVIRSIARIIAELDQKPADVVSEFIPLERADAKEVVEKLLKVFEKQPSQGGLPGGGRAPVPGQPPVQAAAGGSAAGGFVTLSEDSLIVGKIKLEADARTNRIHVVTRPVNLPFIRMLIAQFDSDIPFAEPVTRPLRFVAAGDVLDIVAGAIADPGAKIETIGGTGGGGSGKSAKGGTATGGTPSYGGSDLGTSNRSSSSSSRSSSNRSSASSSAQGLSQEEDLAPEGRLIGATKIIADNRSNSIVILGNKQITEKALKVLSQIDVRTPQVMLTAVIGELTLDDSEQFGIEYLLHSGGRSAGASGTDGAINTNGLAADIAKLVAGNSRDLSSVLAASTTGGLTGFIGATDSLDLIVRALESTGRFRITSRPMIFTSNNKTATISSGQSIPYPGSTLSNATSTIGVAATQSTIEYIDANLQLQVRPLINSEREVTLDIAQNVNNISGTTLIDNNPVPNITTRAINTSVSVANEATVVLGGLVTENESKSRSGVLYLDRIPVLGSLFSTKLKKKTRTELIVLIRPTVTMGAVEAVKAGERAQEGMNFPPDLEATLDPAGTRVKLDPQPKLLCPPKAQLRSEK